MQHEIKRRSCEQRERQYLSMPWLLIAENCRSGICYAAERSGAICYAAERSGAHLRDEEHDESGRPHAKHSNCSHTNVIYFH